MKAILFFLIISGLSVYSQDIHFSMFNLSPLTYNPANTGAFIGDFRVAGNLRSQWKQIGKPYDTQSVSYDSRKVLAGQIIQLGGLLVNDGSSDERLKVIKVLGSASYQLEFYGFNLSVGVQGGLVNKSLSNDITFPDQFDNSTGQFNSTLGSADNGYGSNLNFLDLNSGLRVNKKISSKLEGSVHLALFHINHPNESFFSGINRLPTRTMFGIESSYHLNEFYSLHFDCISLHHTKAKENLYNLRIEKKLLNKDLPFRSYYGGLSTRTGFNRNTDALILLTGVKLDEYEFGLSYDLNISDLKSSTRVRGALELAFIYTPFSSSKFNKGIPCERF